MRRPIKPLYNKCFELRKSTDKRERECYEIMLWEQTFAEIKELGILVDFIDKDFVKNGMLSDELNERINRLEDGVNEHRKTYKFDPQRYVDVLNALEHILVYWN